MKYNSIIFTLFCCALFLVSSLPCSSQEINFSRLSINDGLSQSTIFSIAQDKTGNMWFATVDGLNKYDGYNFKIYRHEATDTTSIGSNVARIIKTDKNGILWIGTQAGLSRYNEEKDYFENYDLTIKGASAEALSFIELDEDHFLVGTDRGITVFNLSKGKTIENILNENMQNVRAVSMLRWDDNIFIGTEKGLFQYHVHQKTFKPYHSSLENVRIQSILKQTSSRLWVATEGAGLFLINPRNEHIKRYRHNTSDNRSISSDFIRSLELDAQNRLWIGTFNDLNIYHESTDSFAKYSHDLLDETSLSQNSIRSIFHDSQGGMWLGTYFGGLNYYHPLKNRFRIIRQTPSNNSLSNNIISCIQEDENNDLWIGTNDGGLNKLNTRTQQFTHYKMQSGPNSELLSNNVKAVYIDKVNDQVFIGTHAGGLTVLNRKTNKTQHLLKTNSDLADNNIYAIIPLNDNELWIGSLNGLQLYNIRSNEFSAPLADTRGRFIMSLYQDKKDRLWVGTDKGLHLYNISDKRLEKADYKWIDSVFENAYINCITENKKGDLWIGTREGLFGIHEAKKQIVSYTTKTGLPNNTIHGILEDTFGRLWISSNKGLTCLVTETGKIKNFTVVDRLQSNEFNNYAYLRSSMGDMYFGGINGITVFRPELLMDNPHMPAPVITRLRLFNKVVKPGDETGILEKSIHLTDAITLKAAQSAFTLHFVVSNYISGQHNQFAYRLKGYDDNWYYSGEVHQVSYSNLPAGKYVFQVKAANNDGRWNESPTSLTITILPVWYETTWAITLFILAAILLIIFIFRYFWIQKSMKAKIQIERMKQERTEELNQMKMRFFINMSHELRTPLTLIIAPLQEVIQRTTDRWTRNQLEHANRNANRLLRIVNQLMDYRRAELGVFELKVRKTDIHNLVKEQFIAYEKLARNKQINYTFTSEIEDQLFWADSNYIELIINNLLSNAFKFTPEGKQIDVNLRAASQKLILEVKDTGIGISEEKQKKIFERFYQVETEQMSSGTGIGLSLIKKLTELHHAEVTLQSMNNEGSCFTIMIPQNTNAYKDGEVVDEFDNRDIKNTSVNPSNDFLLLNEEASLVGQQNTGGAKKGTLLIVEDNEEIRNYLRDGLGINFDIHVAANGEEALELAKEQNVDIILTDVMMPVMDGVKLTKAIKQNIRTCHIPVVILSAKTDIKDQLDALQVGADDYIAKPFSMTILNMKIQNQLRTRHRIFEHYSKSLEIEPQKISFNAMDEELLKKAMDIVTKNIDNIEFSADDFAKDMNMSRSNLHLKLKAITGESTIEFIRKIRFKKACELLEDGRYTVAEVSTMVGFNTPSYFATSFKKYFGYLPTEYIKNRRG
ncbi:MAG: hybrid sensor histidine kinase/response regulator transcription factor [Bacteroidales bacterium]